MKAVLTIAVVAVLAVAVLAVPMVRLESAMNWQVPFGWRLVRNAAPQDTLKVQIAIKQSNLDVLEQKFWAVSDPKNPSYGQYLTTHQVGELVAPPRLRVVRILNWLRSAGVSEESMEMSLHQDLLTVRLNAAQAEYLFAAKLSVYVHEESDRKVLRAAHYSVPQEFYNDIDFVGGLLRFPSTMPTTVPSEMAPQRARSANQGPAWYPLQSSLVNGDQYLLGDFLLRCADGSPAYFGSTTPFGQVTCPTLGYTMSVSTEMHLIANGQSFNSTVSLLNCEQFNPEDTTNLVSLNRMKLLKSLGLEPFTNPNGAPVFCAIQMNNLPNFTPIQVYVRSIWGINNGLSPFYSPYGESKAQLSTLWTVESLRNFYGVPEDMPLIEDNSQSVAEFLGEYYSSKDLSRWMSYMDVTSQAGQVEVIGPNDESNPGGEATLDIQWMLGIAPNARTVFWSLGDLHEGQEPFLEWLTDISNTPNAPLVHSISYADEETTLSLDYMNRINVELQKAGVRGLSMLFASGDDGVLGYTSRNQSWPACASNAFQPQFPSSSPYATSVGGTVMSGYGKEAVATSEGAAARITSGGGFSNYFPRPSYQDNVVSQYLQHFNIVPTTKFNPANRAYPDISGMAHNYVCLLAGAYIPIDGTSASTPLVASMVTRLNGALLANGKPPLGFINPWLYQLVASDSDVVKDVVSGDNGCTASSRCCVQGFEASKGWDPSTGLGTPNFEALLNAVSN
jgi:subtilase family serine protease